MAFKPRYRGRTAPVVRKLINDKLDAGEPLPEAHRAFLDDCMAAAITNEKPPRKTKAARDLLIAEIVDRLKPFYLTKPNREAGESVFDVVGEMFFIGGDAAKTAYYNAVKTPAYLARQADTGEPDYDV